MFPGMKQRLLIAVVTVVSGLAWLAVAAPLRAADGASGISLVTAQSGPVLGLLLILLAAVPAVFLGLVVSARANPLAGMFVWGAGLCFLTIYGGDAEGWLRRFDANVPNDYWLLIPEVIVWHLGLVATIATVRLYRKKLRMRWSMLAAEDHLGKETRIELPKGSAWLAGLICAVAAAVLIHLMIRSFDNGQVVCSLILGFGLAAFAAHFWLPQKNPVVILMAPLAVAVVGYLWMAMGHESESQFLSAMYSQSLSGLGRALPIHYASAGVVGCVLGVGAAQAFRHDPKTAEAGKIPPPGKPMDQKSSKSGKSQSNSP